jgi:histidinol phosphatase-like enzyme
VVLCMRSMMWRSVEDLVAAVNTNTRYGYRLIVVTSKNNPIQLSVMMVSMKYEPVP